MCSAIALLCVMLVRRFPARGRPSKGWLAGIAVAVAAVVGIVTGRMIAWDSIGLRAVTVGEDFRGVLRAGSSDQIRFVVIDGTEVAPSTYRFWVIVHLVLLPALCASGALLAARRMRHHVSLRRELAWPSNGRHCRRGTPPTRNPGDGSAPASASKADDVTRSRATYGPQIPAGPGAHASAYFAGRASPCDLHIGCLLRTATDTPECFAGKGSSIGWREAETLWACDGRFRHSSVIAGPIFGSCSPFRGPRFRHSSSWSSRLGSVSTASSISCALRPCCVCPSGRGRSSSLCRNPSAASCTCSSVVMAVNELMPHLCQIGGPTEFPNGS